MPRTHPYPSDLTDKEWALLEPLLMSSERRDRPPKWPARRVADAVFYLLRSGCAWRMLPREYPLWQAVYYHFSRSGAGTGACAEPTTGCETRGAQGRRARGGPQRGGDRQPGGQGDGGGRARTKLRRGETAFR
jgi:transposase